MQIESWCHEILKFRLKTIVLKLIIHPRLCFAEADRIYHKFSKLMLMKKKLLKMRLHEYLGAN